MATGLKAQFDAAADFNFQKRVAQALAVVAVQVYTESPQPANHPARASYAVTVINDPPLALIVNGASGIMQADKRSYAVARLLAAQGLDTSSLDADITSQIGADWNALAGA
jgi:hypothetical protein